MMPMPLQDYDIKSAEIMPAIRFLWQTGMCSFHFKSESNRLRISCKEVDVRQQYLMTLRVRFCSLKSIFSPLGFLKCYSVRRITAWHMCDLYTG